MTTPIVSNFGANTGAGKSRRGGRLKKVRPIMLAIDLLCIIWATLGAQIARFGFRDESLDIGNGIHTSYGLISILLAAAWWVALGAYGSRDELVLGYGPEEYKTVISASLRLFGTVAVFSYVFQIDTARGYVAIALPLGIASLLAGRWVYRAALVAGRQQGHGLQRVLLIGTPASTQHLHQQLSRHPEAGYLPVASYFPGLVHPSTQRTSESLSAADQTAKLDDVLTAISEAGATTVAITAGAPFEPSSLRELGWHLAAKNIGMIMAPALTDVAGPRIHTQPVAGLPLIHVSAPVLKGSKLILKRTFDVLASGLILSILIGPLLIIGILVRIDSPGPSIFRQNRIGRAGLPFKMYKFRSMVVDAEELLKNLRRDTESAAPLFKLKQDPRVTRIGRTLRRYSVDELPQLINVLRGEMSLVGPRPPLPAEVSGYDESAHRRLLVKPGITGLWQVSGRSDLSWAESIRLDLYYVENWSLTQDFVILLRTLRAVVTKTGAY